MISTPGIVHAVHETGSNVLCLWTVFQGEIGAGIVEYDSKHCTWNTCNFQSKPVSSCLCGAFSKDGENVVTGHASGEVIVWTKSGQLIATAHGHEAAVHAIVFSADGYSIVTGSEDRTVRIWDART